VHWEQLGPHAEQVPATASKNVPVGQVATQFRPERKYPEMQAEQEFMSVQDVQVLGHASQLDLSAERNMPELHPVHVPLVHWEQPGPQAVAEQLSEATFQ